MTCSDIQNRLPAYEEGLLSPEETREIESHLASCGSCRKTLEDLKKASTLVRGIKEVEPPSGFKQEIMDRVREEARQERRFWQKIFFPLYIKIPVQAFAVIMISVLAFYIYQQDASQLREKGIPVPAAPVLEKRVPQTASSPPAVRQENHVPIVVDSKDKEKTKPPKAKQAPQDVSPDFPAPRVAMKAPAQNVVDETKTAREAAKKPFTMGSPMLSAGVENKGYSTVAKQKGAAEALPGMVPGEKSQICDADACRVESSAMAEVDQLSQVAALPEREGALELVLRVKDTDTVLSALKAHVDKIEARHTDVSIQAEKVVFTTELRPSEMDVFLARLHTLGDLQSYTPAEFPPHALWVRIRVMIVQ